MAGAYSAWPSVASSRYVGVEMPFATPVRRPSSLVVRTESPTVSTTDVAMISHVAPAAVPMNTFVGTVRSKVRLMPAIAAWAPAQGT